MTNRIVREETCFDCNEHIAICEYEQYNHTPYVPVTVTNGSVIDKAAVCERCFNRNDYQFGPNGWTRSL